MILEKFIESLSEYEKDHLLSLLKNDKRLREEELRKLIEINKTVLDAWSGFRLSKRVRDIIAEYFAKDDFCLKEDEIDLIESYDLKSIRNLGTKAIEEFNSFKPKN